ncbi:MAG TPA: hypothetical protein DCM27_01210 [Rhodospirillaceae bacterium]|nr:hypothetical protein [Rhodospirillaceae bacterium]
MSIGQYNPRSRYRERAIQRFNKTILLILLMGVCFGFGFFIGGQNAVVQNGTLKLEIEDMTGRLKTMQDELTTIRAEAQTATSRFEQLKTQYERDIPSDGPMREIVDMVKKQISDGMAPDRLAFVLRSARPPRNCSDPSTKRFIIRTPAYKGSDSVVTVAEGAIVISGTGSSAKTREGQLESWFDPTQPVSLTFKNANGENEKKAGTLPFQHSVIAGGKEYRFTLTEGEKSFVKVTFDSCDYP